VNWELQGVFLDLNSARYTRCVTIYSALPMMIKFMWGPINGKTLPFNGLACLLNLEIWWLRWMS